MYTTASGDRTSAFDCWQRASRPYCPTSVPSAVNDRCSSEEIPSSSNPSCDGRFARILCQMARSGCGRLPVSTLSTLAASSTHSLAACTALILTRPAHVHLSPSHRDQMRVDESTHCGRIPLNHWWETAAPVVEAGISFENADGDSFCRRKWSGYDEKSMQRGGGSRVYAFAAPRPDPSR